jgi:hypothetical protein
MSEYREIKGTAVKTSTSNTGLVESEIWYDSSAGAFKLEGVTTTAAWSTGGNVNTTRDDASMGAGTVDAGLISQGSAGATKTNNTEEYDGTAWTTVNPNVGNAVNDGAGFGTQTSAISAGGDAYPVSPRNEDQSSSYDGTSWTSTNPLNTERRGLTTGFGTNETSGGVAGGYTTTQVTTFEEWGGTSWATGPSLNTQRINSMQNGAVPTSIVSGGYNDPSGRITSTETYDGASWTTVNGLNNARSDGTAAGAGSGGPSLAIGGYNVPTSYQTNVEEWDGTSWAATTALPVAKGNAAGNGTSAAAFAATGSDPSAGTNSTYEFQNAGVAETQTLTTS